MADLWAKYQATTEEFMVLGFHDGGKIVMQTELCRSAEPSILATHQVPAPASADILERVTSPAAKLNPSLVEAPPVDDPSPAASAAV